MVKAFPRSEGARVKHVFGIGAQVGGPPNLIGIFFTPYPVCDCWDLVAVLKGIDQGFCKIRGGRGREYIVMGWWGGMDGKGWLRLAVRCFLKRTQLRQPYVSFLYQNFHVLL